MRAPRGTLRHHASILGQDCAGDITDDRLRAWQCGLPSCGAAGSKHDESTSTGRWQARRWRSWRLPAWRRPSREAIAFVRADQLVLRARREVRGPNATVRRGSRRRLIESGGALGLPKSRRRQQLAREFASGRMFKTNNPPGGIFLSRCQLGGCSLLEQGRVVIHRALAIPAPIGIGPLVLLRESLLLDAPCLADLPL
jgi:hypothetical protein